MKKPPERMILMKGRQLFWFLVLLSLSIPAAFAEPKPLPSFSWDTVPRYMHVRKATAFTPEEIKHLATFPLITFEKTTGFKEFGSTERGTEIAARAIKKLNPDAKILYYRNIFVHYNCYAADKRLEAIESPFLQAENGNTRLVRKRVPAYDLTNEKVQDWWLRNAQEVCSSENIDGIFIDGVIKAVEPAYLSRQIGMTKRKQVNEAYHTIMTRLPEVIGKKELIIGNTIRARFPRAGLAYLGDFDGSYIEGLEHAVKGLSRKDYLVKGISAIQKAARSGKIIAFTIGSKGYGDIDMDSGEAESKPKTRSFEKRFTYALALFLICAERHSYFMFSDGYGVDGDRNKLWMTDRPEYAKPLGAPKGPAVRKGDTYSRSFEYAEVTVDIARESATIRWIKSRSPE